MVSLKTQIAGFSFDNCLMNAAGVSCETFAKKPFPPTAETQKQVFGCFRP
ncbi:TPA: hypothetical protein ACFP4A_000767 [Neisseria subflava]